MFYTIATAATTYAVYPPLTALRVHWGLGNFPQCLTGPISMIAARLDRLNPNPIRISY
jgi:hypothetical protein